MTVRPLARSLPTLTDEVEWMKSTLLLGKKGDGAAGAE